MSDTEDQEFEAAFNEAANRAEDNAPPPDDASSQAAETTQAPGAEPSPPEHPANDQPNDIWASAPEPLKAAYEAAVSKAREYEHRLRSDDGRVSRYQRERDDALKQLNALREAAPDDGKDLLSLVQSEEWQKTKADYGDDLSPFFKGLESAAEEIKMFRERFGQLDASQWEAQQAHQRELLTQRAPDWMDLVKRSDFSDWVDTQPRHVQEALNRNWEELVDVDETNDVISRFRAYAYMKDNGGSSPTPKQDPKRSSQLDAARTVSGRQQVIADPSADGDFDAFFQQAAAARQRQVARR